MRIDILIPIAFGILVFLALHFSHFGETTPMAVYLVHPNGEPIDAAHPLLVSPFRTRDVP